MTMRGNVIVPYTTQYEELVFSPPQDRKNQKMTVDSKTDQKTQISSQPIFQVTLKEKPVEMAKEYRPVKLPINEGLNEKNESDIEVQANQLKQLKIPLELTAIKSVLSLLKFNLIQLCQKTNINYPALFKGRILRYENGIRKCADYQLEVHHSEMVYCLFPHIKSTLINEGKTKKVYQVWNLIRPSIEAYAVILLVDQEHLLTAEREDKYFRVFEGKTPQLKVSFSYSDRHIVITEYMPNLWDMINRLDSYPPISQIANRIRLSDEKKIDLMSQLASLIRYLHEHSVVHRDIKPENLLVGLKEGKLTIRLIDFGDAVETKNKTALKMRAGSNPYMAYEILMENWNGIGPSVDIWSAACVFWLFAEQVYPWYFSLDKRDIKTALSLIEKYHQIPIPDGFYFTLLLKKMFALDPKERLTPLQILEQLNDLKTKIEKHPEISLKSQLDIYYKKENHSS